MQKARFCRAADWMPEVVRAEASSEVQGLERARETGEQRNLSKA